VVQRRPYCCRTLVVNLWYKPWWCDKGEGGTRRKQVFWSKSILT